ncbi:putative low-complexity protein [Leptolyngbya sp. PCC 7375]|nr:putative low-complexity protein [Leptolyngbya sp. PCC 7375]
MIKLFQSLRRNSFLGVLAVLGVASLIILFVIPSYQTEHLTISAPAASTPGVVSEKELIEVKNEIRKTWAQILAGAFFFVTAYLTWRNVREADEANITDRFTRAIDQIQSNNPLMVRLGGIYALKRIAKDSENDCYAVAEILAEYIRQHSSIAQSKDSALTGYIRNYVIQNSSHSSKDNDPPDENASRPDVQAALSIFERQLDYAPNFSSLDLRGLNFSGLKLEGAMFNHTRLNMAEFKKTNLKRASFQGAILNDAHFEDAVLTNALFMNAKLKGAVLNGAKLNEVWLTGAQLQGAHLYSTNLHLAKLNSANLETAVLRGAFLAGSQWNEAQLAKADLGKTWGKQLDTIRREAQEIDDPDLEPSCEPLTLNETIVTVISHMISLFCKARV